MITFRHKRGRLIGLRMSAPVSHGEFSQFTTRLSTVMVSIQGRVVFCSDMRSIGILSSDMADEISAHMRRNNPKVERTAMLLPDTALGSLQLDRLIREAGNPVRRGFSNPRQAVQWLEEILSEEEREDLIEFIDSDS